ncbi:MAG: aminodeoxychorismate/anthranilate synthase component II [Planctomycetes bacterium]|nr:aminodeoxychorismate/anthranilate synthase component II [Planctomycetota bacterium]
MILLVDNYDSFVHNLARYLTRLGGDVVVARNDVIDVAVLEHEPPQAIVISPGPCAPDQAGCSLDVIREMVGRVPMLGVCLGHQAIVQALGGKIVRAEQPRHGRASAVHHTGRGLFADLPSPLSACRYHSLVADEKTLPACLEVTARANDGVIMAVAHRELPIVGVQFHPESILTEYGYEMLANFLRLAGVRSVAGGKTPGELTGAMRELRVASRPAYPLPTAPVTF